MERLEYDELPKQLRDLEKKHQANHREELSKRIKTIKQTLDKKCDSLNKHFMKPKLKTTC